MQPSALPRSIATCFTSQRSCSSPTLSASSGRTASFLMQIPSSCSSLQCPALEPQCLLGPSNTEKRGIRRQPFPLGSINKHGYFSPVLPTLVISNCLSAKAVPFWTLQTFPIALNYLPSLRSATVRAVANSITPHLRECTDEDGPCLKSSGCRQ